MPASQKSAAQKTTNHSLLGTLAWFIIVGVSYVLLLFLLAGPHFFGHHIKAGDVAEQDLLAPAKVMVPDEEKSKEQAEITRHGILPALKRDARKSSTLMNKLKAELTKISEVQQASILPVTPPPVLGAQEQVFLLELPKENYDVFSKSVMAKAPNCPISDPVATNAYKALLASVNAKQNRLNSSAFFATLDNSRAQLERLKAKQEYSHDLLLLTATVPPESAKQFCDDLNSSLQRFLMHVSLQPYVERQEWEQQVFEFLPERTENSLRQKAAKFVAKRLESNVIVDQSATETRLKDAVAALKPVMKEINVGTVIVQKGDTITEADVKTLETLGITEVSDPGLATVIAIALFAAYLLFGVYLYTYEQKLFFSPSSIALMATVSIITFAVALFMPAQFPQFVPLPATALILAVTYGRRLTGILTALILLFLSVSELMTGAHLMAIGTASAMAIFAGVKRRRDLMFTGLLLGFMQALGYTAAVIIAGTPTQMAKLASELPLEMLGGMISAIAAIGSLPFLENIFGILTPYRIAELAEPDQPLMRQLEENAPGTYQHSLAVANLAEGGARAIGADVNLVHTGAMYHDIGKMVTPRYFIENQLGDKNPHDFIPPEESREKVLSHVTNGIALAQKYGLPKAVQAFIPEHQGTTVIAYFYHKACQRDGAENVDPNLYRYPGPKPQTRESAIVMLADVSEAVTHSMHDPTMEEVEAAISNVFKARWEDGQFSESGLSHDELEKVKRGFVRVWRTLHHDRLKYPSTTTGRMPVAPATNSASKGEASSDQQKQSQVVESEKNAPQIFPDTCCGGASEWDG